MKYLFFAALFSLAACSGDENDNNGSSNNGHTNNGTNNGSTGSNNGTSNNGAISNNGTASNNGGTSGGTTGGTTTQTTLGMELRFSALATDYASTVLFDGVLTTNEDDIDTTISERTIASGDIGIALGENFYFVLDRGAFGVHEGGIEVYNLDGTLDAKVEINGNVKDAVDVGEKIFVTRYEDGLVQVVEKDGEEWSATSTIDLNAFNVGENDDGDPEVDAILANGTDVLVVLQTLNGFDAIEKSRVVVIDSATNMPVDQIAGGEVDALELAHRNAFSGFVKVADDKVAVGSIGDFGAASADAGIEVLTKGGDGLYTTSPYMTEEAFGLDLFSFLFIGEDEGYALVGFETTLVAFKGGETTSELPGDIVSDSPTAISQMGDYLVVSYVKEDGAGFNVYEKESGLLVANFPVDLEEGFSISEVVFTSLVVN